MWISKGWYGLFPVFSLSTIVLACERIICIEIDESLSFVFPQHLPDGVFNLLATALTSYHITVSKKKKTYTKKTLQTRSQRTNS